MKLGPGHYLVFAKHQTLGTFPILVRKQNPTKQNQKAITRVEFKPTICHSRAGVLLLDHHFFFTGIRKVLTKQCNAPSVYMYR